MDQETAQSILWLALAFGIALISMALAYLLWRTGRAVRRVDELVLDVGDETIPVIAGAAIAMDTFNSHLQKVDMMLDSAVDATEAIDTSVRAVSYAVTEPVAKASGVFAGIGEAVASFKERLGDEYSDPPEEQPTPRRSAP